MFFLVLLADFWNYILLKGIANETSPFFFSTAYISCPLDASKTLGIKLPYFVMIVKNLKRYFSFEVQVRQILKYSDFLELHLLDLYFWAWVVWKTETFLLFL